MLFQMANKFQTSFEKCLDIYDTIFFQKKVFYSKKITAREQNIFFNNWLLFHKFY